MLGVFDVAPPAGFEPDLGVLVASLDAGTFEWKDELGLADADLLARRAFAGGPSIGALLLHVAESEAWWSQEIVAGGKVSDEFRQRVRAEEIQAQEGRWPDVLAMPFEDYVAILDEVREKTKRVLRNERADRVVPIPDHLREVAPGREGFTVRWIVARIGQHEAYHGGQAVMIKRMLTGGTW